MRFLFTLTLIPALVFAFVGTPLAKESGKIIHDAEYVKLWEQHGDKWTKENVELDNKLAKLKQKFGKSPNIIHMMWDDSGYGDVGSPILTRVHGIDTPNIDKLAKSGITFTRMYTEPSCTPTRAAALTGRHPVRSVGLLAQRAWIRTRFMVSKNHRVSP